MKFLSSKNPANDCWGLPCRLDRNMGNAFNQSILCGIPIAHIREQLEEVGFQLIKPIVIITANAWLPITRVKP
jgi:hypothetical protein